MSAFIVEKETIDAIVGATISLLPASLNKGANSYGRSLWAMNRRAVNQRYGELGKPLAYRYTSVPPQSKVQNYKTLRGFLYQCCEGGVPESKLYRVLESIAAGMAEDIVQSSGEYDRAEWV